MRVAFIGVLLMTSLAHAEPPGDTPPLVATAPAPIDEAARQPLAERGLVLGTALTVPPGDVEASARAVFGLGAVVDLSLGLAPNTELWIEAGTGTITTQAAGLKQVLARGARWQIAAEVSLRRVVSNVAVDNVAIGNEMPDLPRPMSTDNGIDVFTVGVMGSLCIDARCRVLATIGAQGFVSNGAAISPDNPWFASASVLAGGHGVRGVAEMIVSPNSADGTIDSMVFLGARLGNGSLALEAGVAIGTDDQDSGVMPMVGAAARM